MNTLHEKRQRRLSAITHQQDTADVDAVERRAFNAARPHLADFQLWADAHQADSDFIEQVGAWWRARGIAGEWYLKDGVLRSKWVARAEDVT